jgi:hypothetical protein
MKLILFHIKTSETIFSNSQIKYSPTLAVHILKLVFFIIIRNINTNINATPKVFCMHMQGPLVMNLLTTLKKEIGHKTSQNQFKSVIKSILIHQQIIKLSWKFKFRAET